MTHIIEVVSSPKSRSSFRAVICIIAVGLALLAWQLRQVHLSAQREQREAVPFATDPHPLMAIHPILSTP